MTKPATPPEAVTLPTWTDAPSVTSYITSLVSAVVAIITLAHPGFTEPTVVQAVVPAVGIVIAGAAQIFNAIFHRKAQIVAIANKKA